MATETFDTLILIARPAAGKSEIIHYLKNMKPGQRMEQLRLGTLNIIDDFPMLWTWFEEDAILEQLGHPRLHTTPDQYFISDTLWHLLIERISLEYTKLLRDKPSLHNTHTVLIEFSRGAEHGGYRAAFDHLSDEVLERAVLMYINVTYEESVRKNRRRYNPVRPDSILEHGLSDDKMERLYKEDDFADFSSADPQYLLVRDQRVPYVVFDNSDDVTTDQPEALAQRLQERLHTLWELAQAR